MMGIMPDEVKQIADNIRGLAAKHHLTHEDIASILGAHRSKVSARLSGRVPFTAIEVFQLACALEEPFTAFFPQREALLRGSAA